MYQAGRTQKCVLGDHRQSPSSKKARYFTGLLLSVGWSLSCLFLAPPLVCPCPALLCHSGPDPCFPRLPGHIGLWARLGQTVSSVGGLETRGRGRSQDISHSLFCRGPTRGLLRVCGSLMVSPPWSGSLLTRPPPGIPASCCMGTNYLLP